MSGMRLHNAGGTAIARCHREELLFGRRTLTLLLTLAASLLAVAPALADDRPGEAAEPPTDQIVIRLASGKSFDAAGLDATAGVNLKHVRRLADGSYVLRLSKRHGSDALRAITSRLAARGDVVLAEPDALMQPFVTPSDTRWSEQWDCSPRQGAPTGPRCQARGTSQRARRGSRWA